MAGMPIYHDIITNLNATEQRMLDEFKERCECKPCGGLGSTAVLEFIIGTTIDLW